MRAVKTDGEKVLEERIVMSQEELDALNDPKQIRETAEWWEQRELTLEDVRNRYEAGVYQTKITVDRKEYVFDEEKSVRWNREERVRLCGLYKKQKSAYWEDQNRLDRQFDEDLIQAGVHYSSGVLSEKQVCVVYSKAYAKWHSNIFELFTGFEDLLDFAESLLRN